MLTPLSCRQSKKLSTVGNFAPVYFKRRISVKRKIERIVAKYYFTGRPQCITLQPVDGQAASKVAGRAVIPSVNAG
jgi:hypothetical protein